MSDRKSSVSQSSDYHQIIKCHKSSNSSVFVITQFPHHIFSLFSMQSKNQSINIDRQRVISHYTVKQIHQFLSSHNFLFVFSVFFSLQSKNKSPVVALPLITVEADVVALPFSIWADGVLCISKSLNREKKKIKIKFCGLLKIYEL